MNRPHDPAHGTPPGGVGAGFQIDSDGFSAVCATAAGAENSRATAINRRASICPS